MTKNELLLRGVENLRVFCSVNDLDEPDVKVWAREDWRFSTCAYYRPITIEICPVACAAIGLGGRAWSFPGYAVDRTPFGVIAHELGHHVDYTKSKRRGPYYGDYSLKTRAASREQPLTSYCPNDAEWFAEMFRLFVTNPNLLRLIRPTTHGLLEADFRPSVTTTWKHVLRDAPQRTKDAAARKVENAKKARHV